MSWGPDFPMAARGLKSYRYRGPYNLDHDRRY